MYEHLKHTQTVHSSCQNDIAVLSVDTQGGDDGIACEALYEHGNVLMSMSSKTANTGRSDIA